MSALAAATYCGQVEQDCDGVLWAVLYCGDLAVDRERVRSLRKGKRRVTDMVLGATDAYSQLTRRSPPTYLNRMVDPDRPSRRHRTAVPAQEQRQPSANERSASVGRPALAP